MTLYEQLKDISLSFEKNPHANDIDLKLDQLSAAITQHFAENKGSDVSLAWISAGELLSFEAVNYLLFERGYKLVFGSVHYLNGKLPMTLVMLEGIKVYEGIVLRPSGFKWF